MEAAAADKLAKALEPHGLKWIEEFLPPDDYSGYVEVRKALAGGKVLTTTGEHDACAASGTRPAMGGRGTAVVTLQGVRVRLERFFAPYNHRLRHMMRMRFSSWPPHENAETK